MDTLRQDLSLAIRGLARSPLFAVTVVLTMALGQSADYPGDPALAQYQPAVRCVAAYYAPTSFMNPVTGGRWRDNARLLFGGTPEEKKDLVNFMRAL